MSTPDPSDGLFRTLADPTRRRLLDLLAEQGDLTVSELAHRFPDLAPSGISKHLMALRAAGLVSATRRGRQQIYHLNPGVMAEALTPWLAKYAPFWSDALEALSALSEGRSAGQIEPD